MSLHVAVAGWLLGPHSGANRRLLSLLHEASSWLEDGERITVLHPRSFSPPRRADHLTWHPVDIPAGPTVRRAWAEQRTLRPLLRELGATIYDHGFLPPPRVGIPLCLTIHDVRDADGEGRWPRLLARSVLRKSLRRADGVVTVSEWTASRLRALVPGCEPIVVPNGVHEREPGESPPGIPAFGYVLHVGHLEPRKNLLVVIEALAQIDAARRPELWLVGNDAGEWPRLRAHAERLGVHEHLRHLGVLSDFVLDAYYEDARLVVIPSRYEGFGLPALEARAHGTRVAVADAGALPEVVGDGALLPVADAAAWAEVMADDRSEAADVIKRRSAAAAACSWSRASRQWLDALRAISSSRS
jgi:glycosyltransferase involved in cell wall biosynthesis